MKTTMIDELISPDEHTQKRRLLVTQGKQKYCLRLSEIGFFSCERKVVYAIDKNSQKYICEGTLSDVEASLGRTFFRANRQYIINIDYLDNFETYEKVKLLVKMKVPVDNPIIVSQEKSMVFKRWINSL